MGAISPFQPVATVTLSSTTSSSNVQLTGVGECVLITNPTASLAYVRFGSDPTVQATTGDTPVLPVSKILLNCGQLVSYAAAILNTGTGSIIFTRGSGAST